MNDAGPLVRGQLLAGSTRRPSRELRDAAGNLVLTLETTDVTALLAAGFKYPEPFKVKADDGITDLYGVMYKPFDFDPQKKYPIIALRLPRAADRERLQDVRARAAPASPWPSSASSSSRSATAAATRSGPSGTTTTATATSATTAWPTRSGPSSSWPRSIPSSTSTGSASSATRGGGFMTAAAHARLPRLLQGRRVLLRQPREQHLQPLVEREAPRRQGGHGQGRRRQVRVRHREELRDGQEPQGPSAPDDGRHRQQRPPGQHPTAWPTP